MTNPTIVQTWKSDPATANQGNMGNFGTTWFMWGSPASAVTAGNTLIAIGGCAAVAGNTAKKATDAVNGDWSTLEHLNNTSNGLDTLLAYFPNTAAIAKGFMGKVTASGAGTITCTDLQGNSPGWTSNQWSSISATVRDPTGQSGTCTSNTANVLNFSGGSTIAVNSIFTVGGYTQFNISNSEDYTNTLWMEVSGVTTTPLLGHSSLQGSYAANTNFNTGTSALGSNPGIVIAFSVNDVDAGTTPWDPQADTGNGWTDDGQFGVFDLGASTTGGNGIFRREHQIFTNPGTRSASFVTRNADHFQALMLGLQSQGSAPPQGGMMFVLP